MMRRSCQVLYSIERMSKKLGPCAHKPTIESVTLIPNAKVSSVKGITNEGVQLKISQPPVDGKANEEVVDYLSEVLGVKKRHVTLDVGAKSRSKVVVVASSCGVSAEDIYDKLLQASNEY